MRLKTMSVHSFLFHWKFWKLLKLDCGDSVSFGFYVLYDRDTVEE